MFCLSYKVTKLFSLVQCVLFSLISGRPSVSCTGWYRGPSTAIHGSRSNQCSLPQFYSAEMRHIHPHLWFSVSLPFPFAFIFASLILPGAHRWRNDMHEGLHRILHACSQSIWHASSGFPPAWRRVFNGPAVLLAPGTSVLSLMRMTQQGIK